MDIKYILSGIFGFAVIILIFNVFGLLYMLNYFFPQNPDISCSQDSDCKLHVHPEWSECSLCPNQRNFEASDESVIAINSTWRPFCPFYRPETTQCSHARLGTIKGNASVRCIENECVKVLESL